MRSLLPSVLPCVRNILPDQHEVLQVPGAAGSGSQELFLGSAEKEEYATLLIQEAPAAG